MRQPHYLALSLLLIVIAVFFPVCGYEFLYYDDNINIFNNALVRDPTGDGLLRLWAGPFEGLYIPLTYTLWVLLAKVAALFPPVAGNHLNPHVFHTANLLIHTLSTLVLFRILRLLLNNDWAAAAGALLFAIHPVQVEAVAWATGMKGLLSGLFALLSLWYYLLALGADLRFPGRRRLHYGLALALFLAAMLAKPGAVVLPLVAGLLGRLLLRRSPAQLAGALLPMLLLALPVVIVTKLAQPDASQSFLPAIWQRFVIAGDALNFHLGNLLLPINLGPDYGRTPVHVLSQGRLYLMALIPYLVIGGGLWKFRHPWAMAAGGVFIAVLMPVLGFLPFNFQGISTVADRYLYLALLSPALGAGWFLSRYPTTGVRIGAVAVALLLGGQSVATVSHWKDSWALYPQAMEVNPGSWIMPRMMAEAYNTRGSDHLNAGRYPEAMAAFQEAVNLTPDEAAIHNNLCNVNNLLDRNDEAVINCLMAIELNPGFADPYLTLGNVLMAYGMYGEALASYRKALELAPDSELAIYNLGVVNQKLGNPGAAMAFYQRAIEIRPDFAEANDGLGRLFQPLDPSPVTQVDSKTALETNTNLGENRNEGAEEITLPWEETTTSLKRRSES